MVNRDVTTGGGPWLFSVDVALASGDSFLFDFRNMEYNKKKGFFKKWLPLDSVQVTNEDVDNSLTVTYNGIFDQKVLPNSTEGFNRQGITTVRVVNSGSTSIPADSVAIEVMKEPYGADEQALEEKNRPPIVKAAKAALGGFL